jgi:hypothetical protein
MPDFEPREFTTEILPNATKQLNSIVKLPLENLTQNELQKPKKEFQIYLAHNAKTLGIILKP